MANTCYDTDLLQYSGTSQQQRALQALLSQYAKIDERTTAQLILFAKKYGAYLNNFNAANQPNGDWQAFMSNDISVTIASIADWQAKDLNPFLAEVKDEVHDAATDDEAKQHFKTIFDLIFTLASQLDAGMKRLPDDIRFTPFLSVAITSNLALPLALLYKYYTTFRDAPLSLINESSHYIDPLMPIAPVLFSGDFKPATLSKAWTANSFTTPGITLQSANVKDDISHVLTHNLFTGPLQLFINGIISIVSKTPAYLEETLNNYPSHQPHYALYLAFLRLFRYAQDHLNNFTQNHLDFYYKDVLQLKNRNAEPGFVHLLFELQKNADQYLLSKNTAFKAGKDAANNDLLYAVTNDVVLQKASVQSLQSLYLNKSKNAALFASTVANSDDGEGAKLTSADNSWFAFKNPAKKTGANIGFAVASNILFLNEGERSIDFVFQCDKLVNISKDDLQKAFTFRLTGRKDWYTTNSYTADVSGSTFTLTVNLDGSVSPVVPYSKKIHNDHFATSLPVAKATLNNYQFYQTIKSLRITSLAIQVTATVKNLSLQSKDGVINAAKPFKPFGDFPENGASFIIGSEEIFQKHLTSLSFDMDWQDVDKTLATDVAKKELTSGYLKLYTTLLTKNLAVGETMSASFSSVFEGNAASPETVNSKSLILSKTTEATSSAKMLATEGIRQLRSTGRPVYTQAELDSLVSAKLSAPADLVALSGGGWKDTNVVDKSADIRQQSISLDEGETKNIPVTTAGFGGNKNYDINTVSGFIKLRLTTDNYSLATYLSNTQKALSKTTVTVNSDGTNVTSYSVAAPKLASPAPQLTATGISLTYTAKSTIDFTTNTQQSLANSTAFYYHVEPFGTREMHPFLTRDDMTFLPVFNLDNGVANNDGGELWIGLKDASADETLYFLFQVSDGSSNPLKNMTEVKWYYLSNNNWFLFDDASVADETNNLTRSGIVTISLPDNITGNNTRADAALLWIKLVADHDTDAVSKLISVRINAAKASFIQDMAKGIEYTSVLAANTISKPATAIAAIKKTEQPYTSFGGRLHETDDRFYIRVSERLRHKHRAVTAWDYERLVLDYFPQVHKAKCIQHTGFVVSQNTNETKYSELLPGHVMVVMVPDLKNRVSANLLRPYTSVGLIEEIQQYLEKFTSPFVKLKVSNPQFEEVQFDFGVTFLPGHDITFYKNLLSDEIEQFLTPWAYESSRDIEFGGKIEKSVVLNFVEERPYVDFVTNFTMNHITSREGNIVQALMNVEEATASTARSILVSYFNEDTGVKHLIQSPANCNSNG